MFISIHPVHVASFLFIRDHFGTQLDEKLETPEQTQSFKKKKKSSAKTDIQLVFIN